MNIIIPLGGKGVRFARQGYTHPKALIPVHGVPMITKVLDSLCINSVKHKIYILYGTHLQDVAIQNAILTKYPTATLIKLPKETDGAAETVYLGMSSAVANGNSRCLLVDCDTLYTENIIELAEATSDSGVFYFNDTCEENGKLYSYISMTSDNTIIDIAEKRKISDNANTGAYLFNNLNTLLEHCKQIIDENVRYNGEYYTSCVIRKMLDSGHTFRGIPVNKKSVISLGTPEQLKAYLDSTYAFLFDLDGTLVDTTDLYVDVWHTLLKKYNASISHEMFKQYIEGNNDAVALQNLVPFLSHELMDKISKEKDVLFMQYIDKIKEIPGGFEFIRNIKQNGHCVYIVTNCNRHAAECILKHFNFDTLIDGIVIGNECKYPKPYPDPYLIALQRLDIPSSRAIVFEDSKSGLLSARGISPQCIVGLTTGLTKEQLKTFGADICIDNYTTMELTTVLSYKNQDIDQLKKWIYNSTKSKYPVSDIVIYADKLKGGFIADVIRVQIVLMNNTTIDCVAKLMNKNDTPLCDMAHALDLYNRENYFYESIRDYVNVNVPKSYGIIRDDSLVAKGVLLENLAQPGYTFSCNLNRQSVDVSLQIISDLAKFHAMFWGKDMGSIFPLLKKNNSPNKLSWPLYVKTKWPDFLKRWDKVLDAEQIKIGENIACNFEIIQDKLSTGNLTLCHGDFKSANMIFNSNLEPYFIDWQYIIHGKGVQDLVFFIIESFDMKGATMYSELFKQYYYTKLKEFGVSDYSKEEYDADFQFATCYFPFFVAMWFGTVPTEELIDVNFPFFFIQKLFSFLQYNNTGAFLSQL